MQILLTGGAGYIGSNVALGLLDLGHKVFIIDNLSKGNENLIPKNAEFLKWLIVLLEPSAKNEFQSGPFVSLTFISVSFKNFSIFHCFYCGYDSETLLRSF